MSTVITGNRPTKNLDLANPPQGGSAVASPISERICDLLAEVGQYLYETAGNYPCPDTPELAFVSRIENALGCKFTLPAHPRDMTDVQRTRQLGRALLALVENFPIAPDTLRALFDQSDGLDAACHAQATALRDAMTALFNAGLADQANLDLYAMYHDLGGNAR